MGFGDIDAMATIARALFVAALFVAWGTALFHLRVAGPLTARLPGASGLALRRGYALLLRGGAVAAVGYGLGWFAAEADVLFGSQTDMSDAAAAIATLRMLFGRVLLAQIACAATAIVVAGRRPAIAGVMAAGGALALQAGHEHAVSMYEGPSLLMLSEILHLLAAGAWLGSLPALLLTVLRAPLSVAHAVCRRYSRYGSACVTILVATSAFQAWRLIATPEGLAHTPYGWMALVKAGLLCTLLVLAATNRWRLVPRLAQSGGLRARKALCLSITAETLLGLAVVVAAAVLVGLPPSIHAHHS